MESITEIYQIGFGPSSSHTMGPRKAAEQFKSQCTNVALIQVTLFGSLASTGRGHLTDKAIETALMPVPVEFIWKPNEVLPFHPNGMIFEAKTESGSVLESWEVYSPGGGRIWAENNFKKNLQIYQSQKMHEIMNECKQNGLTFWEYVENHERADFMEHLTMTWTTMLDSINRGLNAKGLLPGGLEITRRARNNFRKNELSADFFQKEGLIHAYALAVAEENANGGKIVTAPTCGSAGVLPAILKYISESFQTTELDIVHALATAGLIGSLVKTNASISGAEVGCQGEIGTACAMAAAAAAQLLGGSIRQIEYAAEMGLEHHLGLTCDPVQGLVQIPCIERNAFAATRALACATFALNSDGSHRISFDEVVQVMNITGHDLPNLYRETAKGGLAATYRESLDRNNDQ